VLKRLKPHIVHTRNLAGLEYLLLAACAGVSGRVHGEHGRDIYDLHGTNWKYVWLRRFVHHFISCYTVVSQDLASWLSHVVSAKPSSMYQIYNGVDTEKFSPARAGRVPIGPPGFSKPESMVIGTVGRMLPVKDQLTLVRSFVELITRASVLRERLRLVVIGEGPLREQALGILREANLESIVWLPGERQDIPELMRGMDIFVLPSIAEGISNTILEAMATGLPVVATDVGGNRELIEEGITGKLVPPQNPGAMADAIASYVVSPSLRLENGQAGRKRVERCFSMEAMVEGYLKVYDSLCEKRSMAISL